MHNFGGKTSWKERFWETKIQMGKVDFRVKGCEDINWNDLV